MLEATHLILMVLYYTPSYLVIYKDLKALEMERFFVILEYNLYPFIIRTLGGLSDFEVTNCQPFLLLHSALICFLGISLCHKGNTFLSNMCCVL